MTATGIHNAGVIRGQESGANREGIVRVGAPIGEGNRHPKNRVGCRVRNLLGGNVLVRLLCRILRAASWYHVLAALDLNWIVGVRSRPPIVLTDHGAIRVRAEI